MAYLKIDDQTRIDSVIANIRDEMDDECYSLVGLNVMAEKLGMEVYGSNLSDIAGSLNGFVTYDNPSTKNRPKHSFLLEATLADGINQRRMEMESVSRHLGDYRIRFNSPFVSTYLDKNVVSDFGYRKIIPYTRDEETITGMKIISIDTDPLKKIIENYQDRKSVV